MGCNQVEAQAPTSFCAHWTQAVYMCRSPDINCCRFLSVVVFPCILKLI